MYNLSDDKNALEAQIQDIEAELSKLYSSQSSSLDYSDTADRIKYLNNVLEAAQKKLSSFDEPIFKEDVSALPEETEVYDEENAVYIDNTKLVWRIRLLTIIIAVMGVILIAIMILTTNQMNSLRDDINSQEDENSRLNDTIDGLNETISSLETEKSNLYDRINEYEPKATFMDKYIKVIADDGKYTYHTYGCSYFDESSFWAYNEAQVVDNDRYTKCPYCN